MIGVVKTFFRIWENEQYRKRYFWAITGGLLSLILLPLLLVGLIGMGAFYICAGIFEKLEDM